MVRASLLNILTRIEDEIKCEELSELAGLSKSTARRYLKELLGEGFLVEVSRGVYTLTDKGRRAKELLQKTLKEVGDDKAYVVTDPNTGASIPLRIRSLKQLYAVVKYGLAPEDVLREHLRRGYVSNWIKDVLGDEELASGLSSRDLDEVVKIIEELLSLSE